MLKIADGYRLRRVGDVWAVFPVGTDKTDLSSMVTLNETGAFLWEKLQSGAEEGDLVREYSGRFGVSPEEAETDVSEFLEQLRSAKSRGRLFGTKELPMDVLGPLIEEEVSAGREVTLTVTGNSMAPLLHHLRDTVVLIKPDGRPRRGDLPLYRREDGRYVLHRVLRYRAGRDTITICGDAQSRPERGLPASGIVAVVAGFTRKGRRGDVKSLPYRVYSALWMLLCPFHRIIFHVYRLIKGVE